MLPMWALMCTGEFGCNCPAEREARIEKLRSKTPETDTEHGTSSKYAQGCRCTACTAAHAEYQKNYRERKRNAAAGA